MRFSMIYPKRKYIIIIILLLMQRISTITHNFTIAHQRASLIELVVYLGL